jgi:hypothetical protein
MGIGGGVLAGRSNAGGSLSGTGVVAIAAASGAAGSGE